MLREHSGCLGQERVGKRWKLSTPPAPPTFLSAALQRVNHSAVSSPPECPNTRLDFIHLTSPLLHSANIDQPSWWGSCSCPPCPLQRSVHHPEPSAHLSPPQQSMLLAPFPLLKHPFLVPALADLEVPHSLLPASLTTHPSHGTITKGFATSSQEHEIHIPRYLLGITKECPLVKSQETSSADCSLLPNPPSGATTVRVLRAWDAFRLSVCPTLGSHLKTASKYLLHTAPRICYLYATLSPTSHLQTFPREAQTKRAFCFRSRHLTEESTPCTKRNQDSHSQLLPLHRLTLDTGLIPFRLNLPSSAIRMRLLSHGLLKIRTPGCCYNLLSPSPLADVPYTFTPRDSDSQYWQKAPQICILRSFSGDLGAQLDFGDSF